MYIILKNIKALSETAFANYPAALAKGGTRAMVMKSGQRWHCTNAACRCSVLVEVTGEIDSGNPRCVCGGAMKKDYSPPVFRSFAILHFPEPEFVFRDSALE
jgi:hypothetical protein